GRLEATGRLALDEALSDHPGVAAELPPALLSLRAKPGAKRRAAALLAVEEALSGAVERLARKKRDAAWIPLYGAFLAARYDRQAARLAALRERASTARGELFRRDDARVRHQVVPAPALRFP
ncbi:MAG: hypothetical protein NUW21_02770, partial [Elusimicrobia bacterium]|nr:hypothetical protein [Elusimicrobiota bacterium]